jgi:ATP-dependent RNA helicase DeaD
MFDDGQGRGPDLREPRPPRSERRENRDVPATDGAWFRIAVGRTNNADPKWILPLICRVGHVTKKDIGEIRIFDRETKFEISREAEPRFREAIKAATADGDMRVEPAGAPGPRPPRSGAPRSGPPRSGEPPRSGPPRSGPPRREPRDDTPRPHKSGYDPTRSEPPPKTRKPKPKRKSNG